MLPPTILAFLALATALRLPRECERANSGFLECLGNGLGQLSYVVEYIEHRPNHFVVKAEAGTPPQLLHLLVDTGSANLWILGNKCASSTCRWLKPFELDTSSTFRLHDPPALLAVQFVTGKLKGPLASDIVRLGPLEIRNQTFAVIAEEEDPESTGTNVFSRVPVQGMLGLAFREMAAEGVTPMLDNMIDNGIIAQPQTAFWLPRDVSYDLPSSPATSDRDEAGLYSWPVLQKGHFIMGDIDPSLVEEPFKRVPITHPKFWEVPLEGLSLGKNRVCCDTGRAVPTMIVDSGSTTNAVPSAVYNEIMSILPKGGDSCPGRTGEQKRQYLNAKYPVLKYHMGSFDLELKPSEYFTYASRTGLCRPNLAPVDLPDRLHSFVVGSPFMRTYVVALHRGDQKTHPTVGFARARHEVSPKAG